MISVYWLPTEYISIVVSNALLWLWRSSSSRFAKFASAVFRTLSKFQNSAFWDCLRFMYGWKFSVSEKNVSGDIGMEGYEWCAKSKKGIKRFKSEKSAINTIYRTYKIDSAGGIFILIAYTEQLASTLTRVDPNISYTNSQGILTINYP